MEHPILGARIREITEALLKHNNGLRVLLSQNLMADKGGLFKLLAKQLGFTRISEAAEQRMEEALALLNDEVEFNENFLSLK